MSQATQWKNNALVLEAFETPLFSPNVGYRQAHRQAGRLASTR
jgi:hypothetical protein